MRLALRILRAAMAAAIVVALAYQLINGMQDYDLDPVNFFSYFTVLSNIAAAALLFALAARPELAASPRVVPVRGAVTLYMCVTGLVYATLLAPASADVGLAAAWVDLIVHVVGPIVVLLDWVVDAPVERPTVRTTGTWMVFPAVYLVYSLVRGPIAEWYPYPFLDPREDGYLPVVLYSVAILAVFLAIAAVLRWWCGHRLLRWAAV